MASKAAYRLALAATVVLILYGSLSPWRFSARPPGPCPLALLLGSWPPPANRRIAADVVLNLLGYVPLGFLGYAAASPRRRWLAAGAVLGASLLFSASIEMAQLFVPSRNSSLLDIASNTAGVAAGIALAVIFRGTVERPFPRLPTDAGACLAAWLMWQTWPFMPHPSPHGLVAKFHVLTGSPFAFPAFLLATACVPALGVVLGEITGGLRVQPLLGCALSLVPLKVLILGRTTTAAELAGTAAGWVLWLALSKRRRLTALAAAVLVGAIVLAGLLPDPGPPLRRAFTWIPFGEFLQAPQHTAPITLGKLFWYGTAIWLLYRAGWRHATAGLLLAVLLAAVEGAQIYLPGRTPGITDPLLALLAAGVLHALRAAGRPRARKPG